MKNVWIYKNSKLLWLKKKLSNKTKLNFTFLDILRLHYIDCTEFFGKILKSLDPHDYLLDRQGT